MPFSTELDVLQDVCKRLESADIPYMLTGSLAMNYYAEPRMTRDIDLVIALTPNEASKFKECFQPDYYLPENELDQLIANLEMFNLLHLESVIKVDIIIRKDTPYRRKEFERRNKVDLPGFEAWIASREDLILSKLVWAKPSGSELQLRDVRNLLGAELDWAYLESWAEELNVSELLEECRTET